jgi:predicted anti-sigma-YlaC factor YlaD
MRTCRRLPAELEAHLAVCPACRATWRTLQEIPGALRPDTADAEGADDLFDAAMEGVRAGLRDEERRARWLHTPAAGLTAAVGAAALLLLLNGGSTRAGPGTLVLVSLAVGLCVMIYGWVWGWKPRRREDRVPPPRAE